MWVQPKLRLLNKTRSYGNHKNNSCIKYRDYLNCTPEQVHCPMTSDSDLCDADLDLHRYFLNAGLLMLNKLHIAIIE